MQENYSSILMGQTESHKWASGWALIETAKNVIICGHVPFPETPRLEYARKFGQQLLLLLPETKVMLFGSVDCERT